MRILITGATGFLGSTVAAALYEQRHTVVALVRAARTSDLPQIVWDPAKGPLDPTSVSGFDTVINLAGESIAGRWTDEKKARLRESRIALTQKLSEALVAAEQPPTTFICASATGYYGTRGEEVLTEVSPPGNGFLAELCRDWEAAADSARECGIRVLNLRLGIVLGAAGGALATMLPIFRAGFGGAMGNGLQWWPWVAVEDVVGAIQHALETPTLSGAVNVVAPTPVRNGELTRLMAAALGKRTLLAVPAFALKLVYGQMAAETLLASQRVAPQKLVESGYGFRYPELADTLKHALA